MKKVIILILAFIFSLFLFSCSSKQIKTDLTAEEIAETYMDSTYSTWCHTISKEGKDSYKYESELKVFNPDEPDDYIFCLFFYQRR